MGNGRSNCLSCSGSGQVLKGGECTNANCATSTNVISGLGACLSDLVVVPSKTNGGPAPLPTITGISSPTATRRPLEWWQILLMALGCAFIFLVFVMCWRRRAKKQRKQITQRWAAGKRLTGGGWRARFARVTDRLFGSGEAKGRARDIENSDAGSKKLLKKRLEEEQYDRHELDDISQFLDAYDYSKASSRRTSTVPSELPSLNSHRSHSRQEKNRATPERLSVGHSLYSELTGQTRQGPEPRQPVKKDLLMSRFSTTTYNTHLTGSSSSSSIRTRSPVVATAAESYAQRIKPALAASPPLEPGIGWTPTGTSSNNPFRR